MQIEINLFASLGVYKPKGHGVGGWIAEFSDGLTVGDILAQLSVPPDKVKIIFVNGVHADRAAVLNDGDRVGVFPPVGGG
jgi:sulfur carrier protein ThiS